ncbi:MAG: energy-coupled thiamine transporter ThiT [Oscillospiraceae bacterium]|jgi:thiamine transporter|nr:energy-coupled thiamine transporter ThiT [Oscillospiraceae bacterium]
MQTAKSGNSLRALTETAILVAVAFVLSFFKFDLWANGGSVTPASMLFILMIGIRRGPVWGVGGALAYSLLQMLQSFSPPPAETPLNFLLVVLLDYIVAFTILGFSGFFGKFKNGILYAAPVCLLVRFACHFASGILIWASYVPEGTPVWLYSLTYNGSYMGIELVICMAAAFALLRYDKTILARQE